MGEGGKQEQAIPAMREDHVLPEDDPATSPPAIVCDADKLSQVAIIQELGKHGVPVFATSTSHDAVGFGSRYVKRRIVWNVPSHDPRYVDLLIAHVPRGVVFYSNDANAENLAAHRDRLVSAGFMMKIAEPGTLSKVLNKDLLAAAACECGVSVPPGVSVSVRDGLTEQARSIGYPLIIKATNLAGGVYRLVWKEDELLARFDEMEREVHSDTWKHRNARLFLQRWIDTADSNLWNFNALVEGGEILSWSMGRRIRTNRRRDGTTGSSLLYGETGIENSILEANRRLFQGLRYDGFVETEWSKGPGEGGGLFLYDFNPRPSGNIRWVFRSGVPMAIQYYRLCSAGERRFDTHMTAGTRYHKVFYRDNDFLLSLDDPGTSASRSLAILVDDLRAVASCRRHAVDILDPDDLGPTLRAIRPLPWLFVRGLGKLLRNAVRG